MSKNTEQTYAYYISGRNIHLYEIKYHQVAQDINFRLGQPNASDGVQLIYPDETITSGLMFEGTAFIEPFVTSDPNTLDSGQQPDLTADASPSEDSHVNLNRMLSLACVDYIKGMLQDRAGDIGKKEYYMKEFFSKLADSESNKRRDIMTFPVSPYALR
jgi:hypothetical protein